MRISESTFTVNINGALNIPASVLRKMGLLPGDHVRVAYLTKDGQENQYREFLLSSGPLDELTEEQQIRIPNHILEEAHIPADADLQILCLDGCVLICRDSALNPDELASVLEQLQSVDELTASLPGSPEQMREQLEELINRFQEGANTSEM